MELGITCIREEEGDEVGRRGQEERMWGVGEEEDLGGLVGEERDRGGRGEEGGRNKPACPWNLESLGLERRRGMRWGGEERRKGCGG